MSHSVQVHARTRSSTRSHSHAMRFFPLLLLATATLLGLAQPTDAVLAAGFSYCTKYATLRTGVPSQASGANQTVWARAAVDRILDGCDEATCPGASFPGLLATASPVAPAFAALNMTEDSDTRIRIVIALGAQLGCNGWTFLSPGAPQASSLFSTYGQAIASLVGGSSVGRAQFAFVALQIEAALKSLGGKDDDIVGVVRPRILAFGRCATPFTTTLCTGDDCLYATPAEPGCVAQDVLRAGADARDEALRFGTALAFLAAFTVAMLLLWMLAAFCYRNAYMPIASAARNGKK